MSDFMKHFKMGILGKEPEMQQFKLRATNGLVYAKPKKVATIFLRATAVCTECLSQKTLKGKYSITIKDHPFDPTTKEELMDYVRVFVEHDAHVHRVVVVNKTDDEMNQDDEDEEQANDKGKIENKIFEKGTDFLWKKSVIRRAEFILNLF